MVKNPPANAGVARERIQSLGGEDALEEEMVSIQCSCLENPMGSRVRWATIQEAARTQTRLSD